ncbi:CriR family two-component response regulator [Oscillibacter valericigenes Sjm18-20]|nr:CriR family two-component response regulator [Oscillibacter valericigenes Sjm18-20]
MYRVIIIEDDPMVAAINRQYVETSPDFSVEAVFPSGVGALEYLKEHDVSLIILDYYTPMLNGMEFLDQLHGMGKAPAVIMVTSASDARTVRQMFLRGVVDYLVKPFEYRRFQAALEKFRQSREQWEVQDSALDQAAIDRMTGSAGQALPPEPLAKGLNAATMQMIRDFLKHNSGAMYTSEEIAEQVHLSRITVRRYMNYLTQTHEAVSAIDYQTGGRPSIQYGNGQNIQKRS